MKFSSHLIDIIEADLAVGNVPALMGEPGIGKSSFVVSLARNMNTKAFVLPCNQLADKADLTGARLVAINDGQSYTQVFYPHFVVQEAVDYALAHPKEEPILFLDEINRTTPDVTSAVLTLVTLRQLGSVVLPSNLRLMVAGNDKGNVTTLDEASLSRFAVYHVEPDGLALLEILGAKINRWVKSVLEANPDYVFAKAIPSGYEVSEDEQDSNSFESEYASLFDQGDDMLQLTTPRTIDNLSRWLNHVSEDTLRKWITTPATNSDYQNLLQEVLTAHCGNTVFTLTLTETIISDLSNTAGGGSANMYKLTMPSSYKQLITCTSAAELENAIKDLNSDEAEDCFVYSLYDCDNKIAPDIALAFYQNLTALSGDKLIDITRMVNSSRHNPRSFNVIRSIPRNDVIGKQFEIIFGLI